MAFIGKVGNILGRSATISKYHEILSLKLLITGLSHSTDDTSLREAFKKYGAVAEARVLVYRGVGGSRKFGVVTYTSAEAVSAAIQALNQQELHGRRVSVMHAYDMPFCTRRCRCCDGGGGGYVGNFGGEQNPAGGGNYAGNNNYGADSCQSSNNYVGVKLSSGGNDQSIGGAGGSDNIFSSSAADFGP